MTEKELEKEAEDYISREGFDYSYIYISPKKANDEIGKAYVAGFLKCQCKEFLKLNKENEDLRKENEKLKKQLEKKNHKEYADKPVH